MLKLVDRSRLGRGEINSYKFESYYPYLCNSFSFFYEIHINIISENK